MPCESKMEEKCEEKEECTRSFDALDDDLINDMSNGDAQMRRLVRHRLNAQQEKADAAYVKRLLREERFAKGQARTTSDADRRLAALAQREEMKDCEAKLEQEEADAKVAERLDRELKDGDVAKCAQLEVDGELDFEHGLAEAKGLEAANRAAKESEIPNFKGSYLGRVPLVSADFGTSDHLSERSRSVDAVSGTRVRGTRTLKRR